VSAQLDLLAACSRRDLGIARAQRKAGDGWTEDAAAYLRHYAGNCHGQPFLVEDAISVYHGPQPKNLKAWGAATQLAARRRWIVKVGYAPARTSNCSPKCTWRSPQTSELPR
jgi:hypothetical protein